MDFRKVTAMFHALELEKVEKELIGINVMGMTVTKTRGFGENRNFYARDCMSDCVRVEVFTEADKADEIVKTIARTVYQGKSTDGMIAVLPVESLLHIRDFSEN